MKRSDYYYLNYGQMVSGYRHAYKREIPGAGPAPILRCRRAFTSRKVLRFAHGWTRSTGG